MSASITTTGMGEGPISTDYKEGDSVRTWVRRHNDAVELGTPADDELKTTWPSGAGEQTVVTARHIGESDEAFTQRHILEYTVAMLQWPPVPYEPSRAS
jgi:hypothetical protein